jgi:hypothetical protein
MGMLTESHAQNLYPAANFFYIIIAFVPCYKCFKKNGEDQINYLKEAVFAAIHKKIICRNLRIYFF